MPTCQRRHPAADFSLGAPLLGSSAWLFLRLWPPSQGTVLETLPLFALGFLYIPNAISRVSDAQSLSASQYVQGAPSEPTTLCSSRALRVPDPSVRRVYPAVHGANL